MPSNSRKKRRLKRKSRLINHIWIDRNFHVHKDIVILIFNAKDAIFTEHALTSSFYTLPDQGEKYVTQNFQGITYKLSSKRSE